ncbi:hypothetical protein L208DRAFT_1392326 [Tricholoma matsutake]|nr:hypothetical protein L208DRAFT_1392326 [Tricholoma matsutake 945]
MIQQLNILSPAQLPSKNNNSPLPTTPTPRTRTHTKCTSQIDVQSFLRKTITLHNQRRAPRTHTHAKRQLAYLVLNNIPFSIPFDVRVSIFRSFVFNDGNTLNPVLNLISLLSPCRCG